MKIYNNAKLHTKFFNVVQVKFLLVVIRIANRLPKSGGLFLGKLPKPELVEPPVKSSRLNLSEFAMVSLSLLDVDSDFCFTDGEGLKFQESKLIRKLMNKHELIHEIAPRV